MASVSHEDYPELMGKFLAHWALVDASLAPGVGLVVLGGVDRATFGGMVAGLRGKRSELRLQGVLGDIAGSDLEMKRAVLERRLVEFNGTVRAWWRGRAEARLLPEVPSAGAMLERLLGPVRRALGVWARLDAGPSPGGIAVPVLLGAAQNLSRAGMAALLAGVLTARDAAEANALAQDALRAERDAMEDTVRGVMVAYLKAVPVRLGEGVPLTRCLPRISPLPGHTPKPVALTATAGDTPDLMRLNWEPSADPSLSSYELRSCRGPRYRRNRERLVLKSLPDAPRSTTVPLSPARPRSYKLYVVLTTGNERGSVALVV